MIPTARWIGDQPDRADPWSIPSVSPPRGEPFPTGGGRDPIDVQAWMRQQLFDRRIVLLSGTLDDQATNDVGASLMTLDAIGDDPVHLQLDSGDGTTSAALALMDIIDLCGVPVRATAIGLVAGPAVGVLAVCAHREVSPHGRLRLFEPPVEVEGNAHQLQHLAQAHLDRWTAFCSRVAVSAGQSEDRVRDDAAVGRFFSAQEAVDYGLVDEVASPTARILGLPGASIGFDRLR